MTIEQARAAYCAANANRARTTGWTEEEIEYATVALADATLILYRTDPEAAVYVRFEHNQRQRARR